VKATQHERALALEDVEHAVGEPAEERAPNLSVNDGIDFRMGGQVLHDGFKGSYEVVRKAHVTVCVP
jgi:hypothetical protein